jgi:hypothetical protein
MGYAAVALSVIGLLTGVMFRMRVLLWIVALVLFSSVAFAVGNGFSFQNTALTILIAQTIFQSSCFLGLVAAAVFHRLVAREAPPDVVPPSDRDRAAAVVNEDPVMAFDTPNRTPHLPRLFARGIGQGQSPYQQQ